MTADRSQMRLTPERLDGFLRQARAELASFTDPQTGTIQVRAVELVAVLAELDERRAMPAPSPWCVACGHRQADHGSVGCKSSAGVGRVCSCREVRQ
jgi:hypothetical protein